MRFTILNDDHEDYVLIQIENGAVELFVRSDLDFYERECILRKAEEKQKQNQGD